MCSAVEKSWNTMSARRHPTCSDCGVVLAPWQRSLHTCFEYRWVAEEAQGFEAELADYLSTLRGRFDLFYAERTRER